MSWIQKTANSAICVDSHLDRGEKTIYFSTISISKTNVYCVDVLAMSELCSRTGKSFCNVTIVWFVWRELDMFCEKCGDYIHSRIYCWHFVRHLYDRQAGGGNERRKKNKNMARTIPSRSIDCSCSYYVLFFKRSQHNNIAVDVVRHDATKPFSNCVCLMADIFGCQQSNISPYSCLPCCCCSIDSNFVLLCNFQSAQFNTRMPSSSVCIQCCFYRSGTAPTFLRCTMSHHSCLCMRARCGNTTQQQQKKV